MREDGVHQVVQEQTVHVADVVALVGIRRGQLGRAGAEDSPQDWGVGGRDSPQDWGVGGRDSLQDWGAGGDAETAACKRGLRLCRSGSAAGCDATALRRNATRSSQYWWSACRSARR